MLAALLKVVVVVQLGRGARLAALERPTAAVQAVAAAQHHISLASPKKHGNPRAHLRSCVLMPALHAERQPTISPLSALSCIRSSGHSGWQQMSAGRSRSSAAQRLTLMSMSQSTPSQPSTSTDMLWRDHGQGLLVKQQKARSPRNVEAWHCRYVPPVLPFTVRIEVDLRHVAEPVRERVRSALLLRLLCRTNAPNCFLWHLQCAREVGHRGATRALASAVVPERAAFAGASASEHSRSSRQTSSGPHSSVPHVRDLDSLCER